MVTDFNLANFLANGGVIVGSLTIAGYLTKQWMNARVAAESNLVIKMSDLETKHLTSIAAVAKVATDAAFAVAQVATEAATQVALVSREYRAETLALTAEIKTGIETNRSEYVRVGEATKCSIDILSLHVERTNGRVREQEIDIVRHDERIKQLQETKNN